MTEDNSGVLDLSEEHTEEEVEEQQDLYRGDWYVIHTYSGYENKVRANLLRRIESMGMKDQIFQVLIPTEDEVEIKDGKKKITKKENLSRLSFTANEAY